MLLVRPVVTVRDSPAALIVQHLYHNKYLTTINFIEEVLPFTDVIPTATIGNYPLQPHHHCPSPISSCSCFFVGTAKEHCSFRGVDPLSLFLSDFRVVYGVHERR